MLEFPRLARPIVLAPMAGGPSTPELAAAVSNAGGLGFLAAGYRDLPGLRADIERTRALTPQPFGVNLFVPGQRPIDAAALQAYGSALASEAARLGVNLGPPRADDDGWDDKLALLIALRVPLVSFTFGCPAPEVFARLHAHDIAGWVTITELDEALIAQRAGADALVVQGFEAGGHRGTFEDDDGRGEIGLLPLLRVTAHQVDLPLVAAGGIADGAGVAAVLAAGARAAQIGTLFLRCPEAGTSAAYRSALAQPGSPTRLTRAFTGRRARGIANRFAAAHSDAAPAAYPHVHYLTAPLRKAARERGDADTINLWAGQALALAAGAVRPAAEWVRVLSDDALRALQAALERARPAG